MPAADSPATRVMIAIIGTGSSAIQLVPVIQPEAGHLALFQRTAAYVLPHDNRPVTAGRRRRG